MNGSCLWCVTWLWVRLGNGIGLSLRERVILLTKRGNRKRACSIGKFASQELGLDDVVYSVFCVIFALKYWYSAAIAHQ